MRDRLLKPAVFVLIGIFLGISFLRCGNDNVIGSDFDTTKYYTKDEIDTLLAQYYSQSEIENLISKDKSMIICGATDLNADDTAICLYGGISPTVDIRYRSIMAPVNGTLSNFCVVPSGIPNVGSVAEVTVLVNLAVTPLQITYTSADGAALISDTDNVSINQGDLIALQFSETGGISTDQTWNASVLFIVTE